MKVIIASSTEYLKDCVSSTIESAYPDSHYEAVFSKSDLVRHLVSREFKLVIITNDFESSIDYSKLIKAYANVYNYIVFINDADALNIDNKFVKMYERTITMDDLKDIFGTAVTLYDRMTQNILPQLDSNQVVSVWSVSPRNLKTSIAQSLAYSIAKNNPDDKVIVVGISMDNPALAHLIRTEGNMFDVLIPTIENGIIDDAVLSGAILTDSEFSNLHILGGLENKNLFNSFTEGFTTALIGVLKERYKYIILDVGSSLLSIPNIIALRNSDLIVNIIDKDIMSFIYGWKDAKQMLKSFGISASHMVSIINQFYPNDMYSDTRVQSHIGLYNMGFIPNLGSQVADSMIKKRILSRHLDTSKESTIFTKLIGSLHSYITKEEPKSKSGWLTRLFGGE